MRFSHLFFFTLLILVNVSLAEVIRVPDDFERIQEAINSADDSDSILVAAGRYEENINFNGTNVYVIGDPEDPSATVIDGGSNACVVRFIRNEREGAQLNGFTLTNGRANGNGGGGIFCNNSQPVLRNLVITNCVGNRGGGLLCWNANPTITNVVLAGNEAQAYGGGISLMESSSPIMRHLVIYGNSAASNNGGGLSSNSRGRPEIYDSFIRGNNSRLNGGGLFSSGNMIITSTVIDSNHSEQGIGGGVYANGNIIVTGTVIADNYASEHAGGVFVNGVSPSFDRVSILNNLTEGNGGGIYMSGGVAGRCDPFILKMTLAGNSAEESGGGIYCTDDSGPYLNSSIIWGNQPQQVYFNAEEDENSLELAYTDIQGGEDGVVINDNGNVQWGEGIIDTDPLFADPEAGLYDLTWENYPEDDETKSPCIDTGHPDIDADPDGSRADMGAVYFHQSFPRIVVQPEEYDFGQLAVGQCDTADFVISNSGDMQLHISEIIIFPESEDFQIISGGGEHRLEPDQSHQVSVSFTPPRRGFFQTLLRINSNDPNNPEVSLGIFGSGGNSSPQIINPIPDINITEDSDWMLAANIDTVFIDPDGDRIVFQIPRWRREIDLDLRHGSELWFHPIANYWESGIDAVVRAVDESGAVTADTFQINIAPLNDLPGPFALVSPADGVTLGGWETSFMWRQALQNQWEPDSVLYTIEFSSGMETHTVAGLDTNTCENLSMVELAEALNIQLGIEPVEITWRVFADDDSGSVECIAPFRFNIPVNAVSGKEMNPPEYFCFKPNYPNPFNSETTLGFDVPIDSWVELSVFDVHGRLVAKLQSGSLSQGRYEMVWNAQGLQTGVYFLRFSAGQFSSVRKALLAR